jgi:putative PIN family toxin of toxin-antitoxin system
LSAELRTAFLTNFLAVVETIEITETIAVCRDSKDDKFLELAVSGQATYLITGIEIC